jgi:hypothetical protein
VTAGGVPTVTASTMIAQVRCAAQGQMSQRDCGNLEASENRLRDAALQPTFRKSRKVGSLTPSFARRLESVNYCCACLAHDFVLGIGASRTTDCADNVALVD